MTSYGLSLESGPRRRKTKVHVLDLLGCVAVGPTTPEAIAATPEAIRAFLRFQSRHGENVDPDAPFSSQIVEHMTEADFIGNGSPSILFGPDCEPLTEDEIAVLLERFTAISDELGAWIASQGEAQLAAESEGGGRPAREIVRHILAARGSYLAAALGGAPGMNRIATAADRGDIPFPEALAESAARVFEIVNATTAEQCATPRQLLSRPRTLRQALRRLLEHEWEHLAELSRRPGGPEL